MRARCYDWTIRFVAEPGLMAHEREAMEELERDLIALEKKYHERFRYCQLELAW